MTLMEVAVSVAVTSVLMLAIGSVLVVAGKAVPDAQAPAAAMIKAAAVADELVGELRYAISVTEHSDHVVQFTVADRDGDEQPETIRYAWSGTSGDPLTRQYNQGAAAVVLADVQQFDLIYILKAISRQQSTESESDEMFLAGYWSSYDLADTSIKQDEWTGQYFHPSLPDGTSSWSVTRVGFYARSSGPRYGGAMVQLQLATRGGLPSGVVLEEKLLDEQTLYDSYAWQEFSFSNVSGIDPDQGLCLVIKHLSDAEACRILIRDEDATPTDTYLLQTDDAGRSWQAFPDESMIFAVYGRVCTPGEPAVSNTYYLTNARFELRTGSDPAARTDAGVQLLNQPEVTQP